MVLDFTKRLHPEKELDGFTKLDGTVRFYSFVKAIMIRNRVERLLDFGAGRGAFWYLENTDTGSFYRKHLCDLRFGNAEVTACDIEQAVLSHPCSHRQVVVRKDEALPFRSGEFDLIVSDFAFEHIGEPAFVAAELLRVLRPGGMICARTPNKFGYVSFATHLLPNRLHVRLLRYIQPHREAQDVFPTFYKLNSAREVKKHFPGCKVICYSDSAEPAYYFGNAIVYWMLLILHRFLPSSFATSLCIFIKKPTE